MYVCVSYIYIYTHVEVDDAQVNVPNNESSGVHIYIYTHTHTSKFILELDVFRFLQIDFYTYCRSVAIRSLPSETPQFLKLSDASCKY